MNINIKGNINIHVVGDAAFIKACMNGHLEVVQCLQSLGGIILSCLERISMLNQEIRSWLDSIRLSTS
jgi:hypothetical protein